MPVMSETRERERQNDRATGSILIGRNCAFRKASVRSSRAAATEINRPATPPATASSTLSTSACIDDLPPRGADGETHGDLPAPRHGAREQQVRDVRAGNQQHEPADDEQDLQALAVLLFHLTDTGARRHDVDDLLREHADDVGHPVGRIAGVIDNPLPQHLREAWRHSLDRRVRPRAADDAEPGGHGLTEQRAAVPAISGSCCNGIQISGGSLRRVSPKNPGAAMPIAVKGCPSTTNVEPTTAGSAP